MQWVGCYGDRFLHMCGFDICKRSLELIPRGYGGTPVFSATIAELLSNGLSINRPVE